MMKTYTTAPGHRHRLFASLVTMLFFVCIAFPLLAQETDVVLAPEDLKSFEGYYQFEKDQDAYLQFTVRDKGLVAKQMWDGQEFYILPKSRLEFMSQKGRYSAKFSEASNGKVTQVLVFDRDIWKKVPTYSPRKIITLPVEKLKTLEGRYTFEFQAGQNAFLEIVANGDHIVLTEEWTGNKIQFSPLSELEFVNRERRFPLKFIKDRSGTVTKLLAFNRDLWTKVKP
jgi:hypothetical protein